VQKYSDEVQKKNGDIIASAAVVVKNTDGTPAVIYKANGSGLITGSALRTNTRGYFEFYAPNGVYRLEITHPEILPHTTTDITLFDPQEGLRENPRVVKPVVADTGDAAKAEAVNMGTETTRLYNASSNHVRLTNGTEEWAITINAVTGDLAISRIAGTGDIDIGANVSRRGAQLLGGRKTGWSPAAGVATRTTFDTTTVTAPELAERLKALIDDLIAHGLIGP